MLLDKFNIGFSNLSINYGTSQNDGDDKKSELTLVEREARRLPRNTVVKLSFNLATKQSMLSMNVQNLQILKKT